MRSICVMRSCDSIDAYDVIDACMYAMRSIHVMRSIMHVCDAIDAYDVIDTCDAIDACMYAMQSMHVIHVMRSMHTM